MSLKLLLDMNVPEAWAARLAARNVSAVHWSSVGNPRAPDVEVMSWARAHAHVVVTHDLDFGTLLALSHAAGPSVIQVRDADILGPGALDSLVSVVSAHGADLRSGALVVVDSKRRRVRILPL